MDALFVAARQKPGTQSESFKMCIPMVEVFKTNVRNAAQAKKITVLLQGHFPGTKINFDLDDCDKVLRLEGRGIAAPKVMQLVQQNGFDCAELE